MVVAAMGKGNQRGQARVKKAVVEVASETKPGGLQPPARPVVAGVTKPVVFDPQASLLDRPIAGRLNRPSWRWPCCGWRKVPLIPDALPIRYECPLKLQALFSPHRHPAGAPSLPSKDRDGATFVFILCGGIE